MNSFDDCIPDTPSKEPLTWCGYHDELNPATGHCERKVITRSQDYEEVKTQTIAAVSKGPFNEFGRSHGQVVVVGRLAFDGGLFAFYIKEDSPDQVHEW